jgi:parallel beta-helix repeat protein
MFKPSFNKLTAKFISASLIVLLVLVALPVMPASAASSGPNNAGTGTDNAAVGTVLWGNPGNITTTGSPYASMGVAASAVTHYLQVTNYGFNSSNLPSDATINGITVTIRRQQSSSGTGIRDSAVYLLKAGAVVGSNLAATGSNWPTSMGTTTYGGTTNLWGTTWTPAEIHDSNFGVVLSARNAASSGSRTASVDYMQITVTYTPAPGPATHLVITGSGTQVAGASQNLTITAKDANGVTDVNYTGSKSLTFSGASSSTNPVTAPTITDSSGVATEFGTPTTITFTNGVAAVSSGNNGAMKLYKEETAIISVTDGPLSSGVSDRLTVVVSFGAAAKLAMKTEPSSSVPAGALFPQQPAIYVQDAYGNTVTNNTSTVTAAVGPTGTGPLTGTTTKAAVSGTATFTNLGAPTTEQTNLLLTFTDGSLTPVTNTNPITVTAAPQATRLVVTGNGTQVAGDSQNLTITAKDGSGNTVTSYTGVKSLFFTGANSSTNPVTAPTVRNNTGSTIAFGLSTSINFTSGVATVAGSNNGVMRLYQAETAIVCVTDSTISATGSDCLSVVVSPAAVNKLAFTTLPFSIPAGTASPTITVQRQDTYGNPITAENNRTVTLTSSSAGTVTFNPVSPLTITNGTSSVNFTYADSLGGSPTITAASTAPSTITSATQVETIAVGTPTLTTNSATGVRRTSAIFNGTVNANGNSITVTFEYGTTTSYGSTATYLLNPVTTNGAVTFQVPGVLTPGTPYHYRIVGTIAGTPPTVIYGADMAFTTLGASSNNYYVNNTISCIAGASVNPANPSCAIGYAAAVADAGDTVHVMAGTYAETVKPAWNGGSGLPLTFKAESPAVTVTGEAGNASNGGAFRLYGKGYIVIDGFNVTGTADYGIIATSSQYITIKNNHVSYAGSTTYLRPGIYLTNTSYSTIYGNTTDHNTNDGIRLNKGSNYNTVEKNISFGNATQIANLATGINLLANSNYNTIIRNTTYSNEDTGLNFYTGSSHNNVINNLTYGNGDHGIDNNAAPYNTFIGNTVHGNVTVGINVEEDLSHNGSGGAILMNNIFADNGYLRLVGGGTLIGHSPGNIRVDTTSTTSPAATTIDFDLIYSGPTYTGVQISWGGTTYISMSDFHASNPLQEIHGLQADPFFLAPAPIQQQPSGAPYNVAINTGNYHIDIGSGAIDSANSDASSEQTVDIEGSPRVDEPIVPNTGAGTRLYDDRGAYEYQTKFDQTITWTSTPPADATYQGATYTPTATADSGLPVTITVDATTSSICSITDGVVSFIGVGNCTLDANQPGDLTHSPAPQVQQTFAVGKGNQSITVTTSAPANAALNSNFTVAATTSSGLAVTYSASGVCTNIVDVFTMTSGTGTCTVHYNQAGNSSYAAAPEVTEDVTATNLAQTITITTPAPANAAYQSSFTVAATGGASGNPIVYSATGTCTNSGATFTMTSGTGTCTVHYNQAGNSSYAAAPEVTEAVSATKLDQTITFAAPASPAAFNSMFNVAPTSTSGLVVSVTPSGGVCSIAGNTVTMTSSTGTCTLTASQAGDANYNAANNVVHTVTAQKANQTISITTHAPLSAAVGSSFTVAATASAGPVTYSASGVCTNSGPRFTMTSGVGTCNVHYNQAGSSDYTAAPEVTENVVAKYLTDIYLPLVIR